ncbi:hypothetical protein JCM10207_004996 [Rhodosporidiobolus poonsookiae]
MLTRQLASTARTAIRATSTPALSFAPRLSRTYAGQPNTNSDANGSPVTSTSHPTVPHAAPEPTPFFARKNIGLEVTPLMAFIIAAVAIGFGVKNLIYDDGIQHRHGVPRDEPLQEAINGDGKDNGK